jgi:hypothetical protein
MIDRLPDDYAAPKIRATIAKPQRRKSKYRPYERSLRRKFIRYNAFALHVDRYCRNSHDPHLNLAVSYIIAEFVCKGLAREVLVEIARVLFNIPALS